MAGQRAVVPAAVLGLLFLATTACARAGHPESATAAPAAASGPATAAPSAAHLAPAGPAPGGVVKEDDGKDQPVASALGDSAACADMESQQHLPVVDEQVSCRRGTERLYVLTFRNTTDRDTYLTAGPQVVGGGFNVVGSTWVLHVEMSQTAATLATQLHGTVRPGA
jgi:hypothetical protein